MGRAFAEEIDIKFKLISVISSGAGASVADEFLVFDVDVGAVFFIAITPSAEADHSVVLQPIWEGVVGGMDADEPAAAGYIVVKSDFDLQRPDDAVVVTHDGFVFRKLGPPLRPFLRRRAIGRRRADFHHKSAARLERALQYWRRALPVVIVLAIDNQNRNFGRVRCQRANGKDTG